jgi:outer membrane lipase/esterase
MPTFRPLRSLLAAALAVAATPALAAESFTHFSNTVVFGDSLSDSGHFRPALIQLLGPNGAVLGRFTTNPGLVWDEYLADYYGGNATSDNQGGSNYAVGGARVDIDGAGGLGPIPSLATQLDAYLAANGGAADPNALYTVWGGANDLFSITDPATAQATIGEAVTAEVGLIGALQAAGARYVLVANVPDLGLTPAYAGSPTTAGLGNQLSVAYNSALFGGLAAQGLRVIPVNAFDLLHEIVADPGLYGFTNVTSPACGVQPAPAGGSSLFCNPGSYVAPGADQTYLFADGVHPTSAAHAVVAQYAISMLEAPNQMAILPHSEAVIGRSRAERVAANAATRPADEGMRWWANVRGDFQRYGDGDLYDGSGATLDVGLDWRSGSFVYGGFAGWGRQDLDWGRRMGDFNQDDGTLGGFAGWHGENGWVDGQVSYSWLSFDTNRRVTLGAATRTHQGSTNGANVSAGLSGGWMFHSGNWHNGPVGSLLWQRIDVDGFAESDPTLSTSLAYPDQRFRSLIGSLGWQLSYTPSDRIQPYARVTWDHEFHDMPDEAFAQAQSLPGSLPYAVPGMQFDKNYGTLQLGARSNLLGLDANFGASATFAQESGNDASVFLTLGSGF